MIFKVSDNLMIDDNPGMEVFPEFIDMPDKLMKYIVLFYDVDSPYRRLFTIEDDRKKQVCESPYVEWAPNSYKQNRTRYKRHWDPAVKRFKSIIKACDHDIQALEAYNEQVNQWTQLIGKSSKTAAEKEEVIKVLAKFPDVKSYRDNLQEAYNNKYGYNIEEIENIDDPASQNDPALQRHVMKRRAIED